MKNTFAKSELILLSNALLLAIQNNNEAARLTVSEKVVAEIGQSSKALCDLNRKVCAMLDDGTELDDAPNILIRVSGGLVQGVSCNIPGATCWVLDDDALEDEAHDEDADERRTLFERLCSSHGYAGIY